METMTFDQKIQFKFLLGAVALMVFIFAMQGCGDDSKPEVKNRVPTVAEQLTQAQDSANQAKASADSAAQTLKEIQAGVATLSASGRNADGSWKVGSPEKTNVGAVTAVGYSKTKDGDNYNYNLWFTFADRNGFVRTFSPVCPNQSVPAGGNIVLNFHWKEYTGIYDPGCYMIDSYSVVK